MQPSSELLSGSWGRPDDMCRNCPFGSSIMFIASFLRGSSLVYCVSFCYSSGSEEGMAAVLTMRPFLSAFPPSVYEEIHVVFE